MKIFGRTVCLLLTVCFFLCGCAPSMPEIKPTATPAPEQNPLASLKQWLNTNSSFEISYEYMNLAINGFSQKTTQVYGKDDSFTFTNERKMWNHMSDYHLKEIAEYYYCYEDSEFISYYSIDGAAPKRIKIYPSDKEDMDNSKAYMVGAPGLLPEYMQDFTVEQKNDKAIISFKLPVEKILADNTLLSNFLSNVFYFADTEYKPKDSAMILCIFETNPKTYQPKTVTFDFTEIKPYVLSSGAQSGEYALDTEFITLNYTFNFDLPDTIEAPSNLVLKA